MLQFENHQPKAWNTECIEINGQLNLPLILAEHVSSISDHPLEGGAYQSSPLKEAFPYSMYSSSCTCGLLPKCSNPLSKGGDILLVGAQHYQEVFSHFFELPR